MDALSAFTLTLAQCLTLQVLKDAQTLPWGPTSHDWAGLVPTLLLVGLPRHCPPPPPPRPPLPPPTTTPPQKRRQILLATS